MERGRKTENCSHKHKETSKIKPGCGSFLCFPLTGNRVRTGSEQGPPWEELSG